MNAHAQATPAQSETRDQYTSTIEAVAAAPSPGNDPAPDQAALLSQSLRRQRWSVDSLGVDWRRELPPRLSQGLAGIYRVIYGASGLASLLLAHQDAGDSGATLNGSMHHRLMTCLCELTHQASAGFSEISEALQDIDTAAERGDA